jgi:hypothetical protein
VVYAAGWGGAAGWLVEESSMIKKSMLITLVSAVALLLLGCMFLAFVAPCAALSALSSLFFDDPDCHRDALEDLPPVYPNSQLVAEEDSAGTRLGYLERQYTTADPPNKVAAFYDQQRTCDFDNSDYFAECVDHSGSFIKYAVRIEKDGEGSRYHLVADWNCKGID